MVPKRLREAREAAGLSQEKLAQLIDIETINSRSRISNYESGRFTPTFDFIQRVAKQLDYPEGYFYTADDNFAKTILTIYRNKDTNNIYQHNETITELKDIVSRLNKCLNKF